MELTNKLPKTRTRKEPNGRTASPGLAVFFSHP